LKDNLRFFNDDHGIKDFIYHYLHGNKVRVYVEYYNDDEDGENEQTIERREVTDPTEASNQVKDEFRLDGRQNERQVREERETSHIDKNEQKGRCSKILENVGNEDFIGL